MSTYYTGAFSIGGRVLCVKVIGKFMHEENKMETFLVKITSKSGRGYTRGEEMEVLSMDLWDSVSYRQGPKLSMVGKTWKNKSFQPRSPMTRKAIGALDEPMVLMSTSSPLLYLATNVVESTFRQV